MIAGMLVAVMVAGAADWTPFSADPTRPATTSRTLMVTETTERPLTFDARAALDWAHNPLVVYGIDGSHTPWIANTMTMHLSMAGSLGPLWFSLSEPLAAADGGEGLDGAVAAAGDPQLSAVLAWHGRTNGGRESSGVGLGLDVTAPLGGDRVWLGDPVPTASLGLVADIAHGGLLGALNAGVRTEPSSALDATATSSSATLGGQLWARLGVSRGVYSNVALSLELQGATGVRKAGLDQTSPLEALLGATWGWAGYGQLRAAVGVGLLPGVGAPAMRVMLGVGRRPFQDRTRVPELVEAPPPDQPTPSSSTSKTSVALGGMTPPAPRAP